MHEIVRRKHRPLPPPFKPDSQLDRKGKAKAIFVKAFSADPFRPTTDPDDSSDESDFEELHPAPAFSRHLKFQDLPHIEIFSKVVRNGKI